MLAYLTVSRIADHLPYYRLEDLLGRSGFRIDRSPDLLSAFAAGTYEDDIAGNSGWSTGDWNADGEFTSADLVAAIIDGGYEQGLRPSAAAVPEPTSIAVWTTGLLSFVVLRHIVRRRAVFHDADATRRL